MVDWKKKVALPALVGLLGAFLSPAWAQQTTESGGTGCSTPSNVAILTWMSSTASEGSVCTVTDAVTDDDCTVGGGTMTVTCWFCDGAWQNGSCGAGSAGGSVSDKHPEAPSVDCAVEDDIGKVVTLEDNGVFQACTREPSP